jgi:hypothetical protein
MDQRLTWGVPRDSDFDIHLGDVWDGIDQEQGGVRLRKIRL